MRTRIAFLLGFLTLLLPAAPNSFAQTSKSAAASTSSADSSPAQRRLSHLRHGINLSDWFSQFPNPPGYTREYFESAITAQDLALIRQMGFDHVRLCLNPQPMFHPHVADQISSDYLGYLDSAMKMILDQGLAVELDIHAGSDFKKKLATDDEFVEQFADFWRALALHYSPLDPDLVFFEVLNEPELHDPYRWYGIESKLVTAIRQAAPANTIIVTGAHWADDDDLVFLEPLRDTNLIYTFHFYEPHIFTHQGATWSENYWRLLKGVPYPSTPENVQKIESQTPDAIHRLAIARYGMDYWNAARIDEEITQVVDWAKHWNVPVICNEFGVHRKTVDPKDRAAWITDVRTALEKHNIGWAMWDYSGNFGVVTRPNGPSLPDELTVRALGRTLPPAQK